MSTAAETVRRPPRRRRWLWWLLGLVVLAVLGMAVWVGARGVLAVQELKAALPAASRVQSAVTSGDATGAASGVAQLRTHADRAHALTSDPIWRLASVVPGVGPNLRALGGVAASAASVSDHGLGALAGLSGKLSAGSLTPHDGALDLAPLAAAAPALATADAAVRSGDRQADAISTAGVVAPLASAVSQYRAKLDELAGFTDAASRAASLLPGMLGDDGPRSYLVLVLNNAELRASGGIPGAVVHVTADHGEITFDNEEAATGFGPYDAPVAPLGGPTEQLFGEVTGEYMQDVTLTPHFDQSAQLARAMWKQRFGQTVDGVVSLDPVALSDILQATGPVTVSPYGTELSSQNVVPALLSQVYARFSQPQQQDAFFAASSAAVFAKLSSGAFSPSAMLAAFERIGAEHRLNVWSSHPAEQRSLAQTTLAGGPAASSAGQQRFGVYLADGTGSKMDYYLHTSVALGQLSCTGAGGIYVVQVTLRNGLPGDQTGALPAYVSGDDVFGVPVGTIRTQVTVYGSPGVDFGNAVDGTGAAQAAKFVTDDGRSVAQYVVDLKPGQSSTVRLVFKPKAGTSGAPAAEVTPQINPVPIMKGDFSCATLAK